MSDFENMGVPSVPHVMKMFQAMQDSLAGNEGFNLTHAQHYAAGVLGASADVSFNQVTGNEGIFSSIGNAFKSIWDYIVKTLKSVWNFFFNRDAKDKAEEAKGEVKDAENALLTFTAPEKLSEEEGLKEMASIISALEEENNSEATNLAEQLKGMKADGWSSSKAKLKGLGSKIAGALKNPKEKLKKDMEALSAFKTNFATLGSVDALNISSLESAASQADLKEFSDILKAVEKDLKLAVSADNAFSTFLKSNIGLTDVSKAAQFLKGATNNLDLMTKLGESISKHKSKIEGLVKQVESDLEKAEEGDKEKLKNKLTVLQGISKMTLQAAKAIELNVGHVTRVTKSLKKAFGLK